MKTKVVGSIKNHLGNRLIQSTRNKVVHYSMSIDPNEELENSDFLLTLIKNDPFNLQDEYLSEVLSFVIFHEMQVKEFTQLTKRPLYAEDVVWVCDQVNNQ